MSSKQKTVDRQHKCNWANHVESDLNWADIKKITLWMPWARPCWIFFTGDCFQRILFGFKLFLGVRNSVDRLRGFYISQRLNCTKYFLTKQRHSSFFTINYSKFRRCLKSGAKERKQLRGFVCNLPRDENKPLLFIKVSQTYRIFFSSKDGPKQFILRYIINSF